MNTAQKATETDLFLAILALDAYNRGYNPGMVIPVSSSDPKKIGDAEIVADLPKEDIGFYAVAYNWDGQTVISYRGTTFEVGSNTVNDIIYGWSLSAGFSGSQPQAALDFYTQIATSANQPIVLTGHSLGGGLAGFVSDLTGAQADIFNNIAFGTGVVAQVLSHDLSQGMSGSAFVFVGYDPISGASYETPPSSSANVRQFITDGEVATGLRVASGALSLVKFLGQGLNLPIAEMLATKGVMLDNSVCYSQTLSSNADAGILGTADLHSQALMVLLLYADVNNNTDWASVGPQLYSALFSDTIANALGLVQPKDGSSWYPPSARMMAAIAYSAIDSGYEPFGNTGIVSLFNDADILGEVQSAGQFTGLLAAQGGGLLTDAATVAQRSPVAALTEIAVQFAGDQAKAANTDDDPAQGAFWLNGSTLTVNLDPTNWTSTFENTGQSKAGTTSIIGVGDFFASVVNNLEGQVSSSDAISFLISPSISSSPALNASLVNRLNNITEIDIALGGGNLSAAGDLPMNCAGDAGGAMLIGGLGMGTIIGSDSGDDIIVGGEAVVTGNGDDLILAGDSETLKLGAGNNVIMADSYEVNLTVTYTATGEGTDLIIGNAFGGDTFTFTNADEAGFTVVWGGTGNDTFNFQSSSYVSIVEVSMSGINAADLANLNVTSFEQYVCNAYGVSAQGTIVILNPESTDTISYNNQTLGTPVATLQQRQESNVALPTNCYDPQIIADQTGGLDEVCPDPDWDGNSDWQDYAYFETPEQHAYGIDNGFQLDFPGSVGLFNAWLENYELDESYVLLEPGAEIEYEDEDNEYDSYNSFKSSSLSLDGLSQYEYCIAGSARCLDYSPTIGGLNLINYNPGDFGIGMAENKASTITRTSTTYEVLLGWSYTDTYSLTPIQLGVLIDEQTTVLNGDNYLYDPNFTSPAYARQTVDLADYLSDAGAADQGPGSSGAGSSSGSGGSGSGSNGGGSSSSSGGSSGNNQGNVSVDMFKSSQDDLDHLSTGFAVTDSAANVSSAIDALNDDWNVTKITLNDSDPTLTLSVTQTFYDTSALQKISNDQYGVAVVDTTENVSWAFDALDANQTVTSIELTDAGTSSLALTAFQALLDTNALAKIFNADYTIAVSDTAADISCTIDALNSDQAVRSITLVDGDTQALSLSVAQLLGDTRALGEITNANYGVQVEDTAANILANATALSADGHVTGAVVVDTVANVLNSEATLDANSLITSITVVDSVANVFGNLASLQADAKITSVVAVDTAANILANVGQLSSVSEITSIGVADTAANVSANVDALNADAALGWIMLTDASTPTLTLTAAQAVNDTGVLARIANPNYVVGVVDTAAAVAANIDILSALPVLAEITLTDAGSSSLTLTAAQAVNNAAVIAMISNSDARIIVSDTAANVAASLDALNADPAITGIELTDAGTPTLTLSVGQALGDTVALGKIENTNAKIAIVDTAVDVSLDFDALAADRDISSISLTDGGTPTLVLSATQAMDDTDLLGKISNSDYTITILDSAANMVANASSLTADNRISSIVAVGSVADLLDNSNALAAAGCIKQIAADSAANVAANIDAINADSSIVAVSLTDAGTPTLDLTVAQLMSDGRALQKIANSNFAIDIIDTAANVATAANALSALGGLIASVALTDADTLTLDPVAFRGDAAVLAKITNADFKVDIAGLASVVAAELDRLNGNPVVASITLTDTETPVLYLSATQVSADADALSKVSNSDCVIAVTDTAANISANIDALNTNTHVAVLHLTDDVPLTLSARQAIDDQTVLSDITNSDYSITVTDTAANVAANLDALNADSNVTSIILTDQGTPELKLTAEQAANDTLALSEIVGPYTVTIIDSSPVNHAPVVAEPLADQTSPENQPVSFGIPADTFSDADGDNLTYTAQLSDGSDLPAWLQFDAETRTFTGQPPANFTGVLNITVVASDGQASVSDAFKLTIDPAEDVPVAPYNHAPVLQDGFVFPDSVFSENQLVVINVQTSRFSDPDGDLLTFAATLADGSALPSWLSYSNGQLRGTPPQGFRGVLDIAITASDGTLSTSSVFRLTIDGAPKLVQLHGVQLPNDAPFSFALPDGSFTDPGGDVLSYTATLSNGAALPSWLSFDGTQFTGTPPTGFNGTLAINVTASDGLLSASGAFNLMITWTPEAATEPTEPSFDRAPVFSGPLWEWDQPVVAENVPFAIDMGTYFSDPDNDPLTFTATLADGTALPSWLTIDTIDGDTQLVGTPPTGFHGALDIMVTASDGWLSTSGTIQVTVDGGPPTLAKPLRNLVLANNAPFSVEIPAGTFADPDGNPLTLGAFLDDEYSSDLPSWLSFDGTKFTGTPPAGFTGEVDIYVYASDGSRSTGTSFNLTFAPVGQVTDNRAPVFNVLPWWWGNLVVADSTPFAIDMETYFSDPDNDPLTFTATLADGTPLPSWLIFDTIDGDTQLVGTPPTGFHGALDIMVTASDGSLSTSGTLQFTVDDAPTITTPLRNLVLANNAPFSVEIPAGTFVDPDGDPLTLTACLDDEYSSDLPSWLSFDGTKFTGTPPAGFTGEVDIWLVASDGSLSTGTSFNLTFAPADQVTDNRAPVFTVLPWWWGSPVVTDNTPFAVDMGTYFSDPDNDPLTFTATLADGTALPSWLTFDTIDGYTQLGGTPPTGFHGVLDIMVTASDGSLSTSGTIEVTVDGGPPTITKPLRNLVLPNNAPFSVEVPAGTFVDPDGDPLTLEASLDDEYGSDLPSWLSFDGTKFTGTPPVGFSGEVDICLYASDGSQGTYTSFNLTFASPDTLTATWAGSPANATMTGNDYGTNIFRFGAGQEVANGGVSNNIYEASASTDQAKINLSSASGSQNEIDFLGNVTDENLWFKQSGNDLEIDLLGTNMSVTVSDWFSGSSGALQEITAGGLKIDGQISQLVQAMAAYSADNPGFDPTSSSIHTLPSDSGLQNAIAAAWH